MKKTTLGFFRIKLPTHFSFTWPSNFDLYKPLLFLFFFTLHADQLMTVIGGYSFRLNNCIAFCSAALFFFKRSFKGIKIPNVLFFILAGLLASMVLSGIFSPYKVRCGLYIGWTLFTLLCYFIFPYLLFTEFEIKELLKLYFLSFFLTGIVAFLQLLMPLVKITPLFANQPISGLFYRPSAFSYEPSFYVLYMTPFIVIMQMHKQFNPQASFILFKRIGLKMLLFVHFLFLASTATSALFVYILYVVLLALFNASSFFRLHLKGIGKAIIFSIGFFILLMTVCLALFPSVAKAYFFKFFIVNFRDHHSFSERFAGIYNAWNVFKEHPFLGVGYGGVQPFLLDRWLASDKTMLFALQDRSIGQMDRILKFFEPSNALTELLASVGIFGALFWGGLILFYCKSAVCAIGASCQKKELVWNVSFFFSVLLMLVILQFNQGLLRTYIWTHLAVALAIAHVSYSNSQRLKTTFP